MLECKQCRSKSKVKNGHDKNGKQRYKCKECNRSYIEGDLRKKYSLDKKMKVLCMYLEGVGIRSIERLEKVPNPLIIQWIRKFSKVLKSKLKEVEIPEDARKISIIELDELFSYCQKKLTKSTYGLLLIGTEIKLLISK
jgi:transposase-like protein